MCLMEKMTWLPSSIVLTIGCGSKTQHIQTKEEEICLPVYETIWKVPVTPTVCNEEGEKMEKIVNCWIDEMTTNCLSSNTVVRTKKWISSPRLKKNVKRFLIRCWLACMFQKAKRHERYWSYSGRRFCSSGSYRRIFKCLLCVQESDYLEERVFNTVETGLVQGCWRMNV